MNRLIRRQSVVAGALVLGLFAFAGTALAGLPTADAQSVSTDHGVAKTITLTGTADAAVADFTVTGGPSHGNLDNTTGTMTCDGATPANCSADVLYTPDSNYEGPDSFTFNVNNATDGTSGDATVSITVGSAPVAVDDPGVACGDTSSTGGAFPIIEDWPVPFSFSGSCGVLANDTDADGDALTWSIATDASHGTVTKLDETSFSYQPAPNFSTIAGDQTGGTWNSDSFTYKASDGVLQSNTGTMRFWVAPINDPPTFTAGSDVGVGENSGAYSAGWATNISPGPANESDQTVHFVITNVDLTGVPNLFSVAPAIADDGTLTFTPGTDQVGLAHVTVHAQDNGGLEDYGVTYPGLPVPDDTSDDVVFDIAVNAVNQAPSFTAGSDQTVNEDSGAASIANWATSISPGPDNESSQTVSFQVTSNDNPSLFSAAPAVSSSGTLTFTPGANRNGVANLTVVAKDNGGTANGGSDTSPGQTLTITVNPVNDPPNAVNDTTFVVPENSPGQSLNVLANDTSLPDAPETLTVTAVTQGVHGTVTIPAGGGSVTYKPVAGYYGSDFFTYTITDPGLLTDTATVVLTIAKDTTAPTVSLPAQHIVQLTTMTATTLLGRITWTASDAGVGISRFDVQRSTSGGAFATLTLVSPTSTSIRVAYTFGTSYQYRVRAVDKNGNVSAWRTGPVFAEGRYQESSGYVHYGGTWALTLNSNDSGGAARYTYNAGRTVSFTHVMRDVAFVAPRSSTRGSVDIYVDGVKQLGGATLKATTTAYRQVIWQFHFSTIGTHTIKIVVRGTGRVDLDCFAILV